MKSIGVVGGAGPHAGALLYEKIIRVRQETYGSHKDEDFPYMMLLNIPFSDMLENPDESVVAEELEEALTTLEKNGMDLVCIACNTAHAFLRDKQWNFEFIDLRRVVKDPGEEVLILCTSTSRNSGVYGHLTQGIYLDSATQQELDALIDRILSGKVDQEESSFLASLIEKRKCVSVLLGCTELSLLHARYPLNLTRVGIIDPLDQLAHVLCSGCSDIGETH